MSWHFSECGFLRFCVYFRFIFFRCMRVQKAWFFFGMCTHLYMQIYKHKYVYIRALAYTHTRTQVHVTCIHTRTHMYIHACVCTFTYTCAHATNNKTSAWDFSRLDKNNKEIHGHIHGNFGKVQPWHMREQVLIDVGRLYQPNMTIKYMDVCIQILEHNK